MKIPLIKADLPPFEEVEPAFREILANGRITNFGKYVQRFEQDTAAYLGVETVAVSSGTAGLLFTLHAMGVEEGQKVVLPSFSFMATAQAVLYAGGVPVFAECREDLTLCPDDLAAVLAKHPDAAAVIPVHVYGLPCQIEAIARIVDAAGKKRGRPLRTMYDAAHAFGAAQEGRKAGGWGDAEVFSLSVTKTLVSVEGGLVATRDAEIARRVRKMRNYGIEENYDAWWPGLNGKMSEFHAIVGIANLKTIDRVLAARARNAAFFRERIESRTPLKVFAAPPGVTHTYKDFSVLLPAAMKGERDALMKALAEQGVETRAYFHPPIHEQRFFKRFADRPLPRTEDLARRVITLPFFTTMSEAEMSSVADALERCWKAVA